MINNKWVKLYISTSEQVLVRILPVGKDDYKLEESVILDGKLHKKVTKDGDIVGKFGSYNRDNSLKFMKSVRG